VKVRGLTPLYSEKEKILRKAVFDIETFGIGGDPYAVGFYDGNRFVYFEGSDSVKKFVNFYLSTKYRNTVCYAHNGGKYDFNYFLEYLLEIGYHKFYEIRIMRQASRVIQITLVRGKHSWKLRDSMALFNFSLAKLTESFSVAHKKGEIDHDKITPETYVKLKPVWLPYLESDCLGLYEILEKFEKFIYDKYGCSLRKNITLAQLAMRIYRRNFMPLELIPSYQSREDEIRQSYFGGRTEIFKFFGENLNYYDVNSLYPYVMKNWEMPVGVPIKSFNMDIDDFGVAFAKIEAPKDLNIPVLPYRLNTGSYNKLIFPVGNFSGWYTTPELRKAAEKGYQIEIEKGFKFNQYRIFETYVDEFYKMKSETDPKSVDYIVAKLLMNSLYGKFGQRRDREEIIMFPTDILGLEPIDFGGELDIYKRKTESRSTHILPAIAAFVTSYARLTLYELLDGNDPYYCDTDSIITEKSLNTGKLLGELKLENEIKKGIFLRPKMYAIQMKEGKAEIKAKGFPKSVREKFTFDMFSCALKTNDYTELRYDAKADFATMFTSLRRNTKFRSLVDKKRSIKSGYDKRIILEDGINTKPICL